MLLDHAAENGAEVREQTAVKGIEFFARSRRAAVQWQGFAAAEKIIARYVIDASGRHSVLGNHFKLKETYAHLQKISIFAHYEGVRAG